MLLTDHTKDFNQLNDIAHQANFKRPNVIDAEHNKMMIDPFQKLKGATFDRRYIQEMVTGHAKAIAIYTKASAEAQNPALKSYAEQALPVLQKHLEEAKALQNPKRRRRICKRTDGHVVGPFARAIRSGTNQPELRIT